MTSYQIASAANLFSVVVVLLISLLTATRYHHLFFRYWTLAYCSFVPVLLIDAVNQHTKPIMGLSQVEVISGASCMLFFLLTGDAISQRPDFRRNAILVSGASVLSLTMFFAGLSSSTFMSPIALLIFYAILRLGVVLLRVGRNPNNPPTTFLAIPLILLAVLPLAYPLLAATPYHWVGFAVAALLEITVGTGMILYLLEQVGSEMRTQQMAIVKAKNEFLSCVSHELRTPLSIIIGYSELLSRELNQENELHEEATPLGYVEQIQKATARLTRVVSDLLDYSQIESNRLAFLFDEDDLAAVVGEAVENIRSLAMQSGIQLEFTAPDHALMMRMDSNRMTQVLHNILDNSIKFSPPDSKIEVRVSEEPDGARITIKDKGPGIPEELQTQIFEKFYQVDSRSTRTAGGLGLGLAICKAIISEHHGAIGAENSPEGGSTFWFKLPYRSNVTPLNPAVPIVSAQS